MRGSAPRAEKSGILTAVLYQSISGASEYQPQRVGQAIQSYGGSIPIVLGLCNDSLVPNNCDQLIDLGQAISDCWRIETVNQAIHGFDQAAQRVCHPLALRLGEGADKQLAAKRMAQAARLDKLLVPLEGRLRSIRLLVPLQAQAVFIARPGRVQLETEACQLPAELRGIEGVPQPHERVLEHVHYPRVEGAGVRNAVPFRLKQLVRRGQAVHSGQVLESSKQRPMQQFEEGAGSFVIGDEKEPTWPKQPSELVHPDRLRPNRVDEAFGVDEVELERGIETFDVPMIDVEQPVAEFKGLEVPLDLLPAVGVGFGKREGGTPAGEHERVLARVGPELQQVGAGE